MLSPLTTKTYQIEGVWPTVRDDDWCGEWKILARRPSSLPVPTGAVAAGASVTPLVAAASTPPRVVHEATEPIAMAAD
jgi:hypothetical protein